MVRIPQRNMKGQMRRERVESADRQKQMESIRHTMESTIKSALARKNMNGQPFAVFVDGEGNVQVQHSTQTKGTQAAGSSVHNHATAMDQAEDFADDELFSQPMTRAKGKRVSRATRGRGRSAVRRDTTSKATYPYPQPTAVSTSDSDDEPPIPPRKQYRSLQIQDEQAVKDFLHSRLKGMQQLADKKIAKAWIKSICPKKQANFPYQNKKTGSDGQIHEQPPRVPGWWPEHNVCRFIEPDHIKRRERMDLCLHLLRLRPSPETLKKWNEDKTEPNATHMYDGWTAFLRESAGPEIFDELPKEDKIRTEQKKKLMGEMYQVAQMEEDYKLGGCDGTTTYHWEEEQEEKKPAPAKRARSISADTCVDRESRQSSASVSCTRAKRVRQSTPSDTSTLVPSQKGTQKVESELLEPQVQEQVQVEEQSDGGFFDFSQADNGYDSAMADQFCTSEAESRSRRSNPFIGQYEVVDLKREPSLERHHNFRPQPQQHQQQWMKYEQDSMQWTAQPQPANSFIAGQSNLMPGTESFHHHSQPVSSSFPGRQGFAFPQYPAPGMIQIQQVNHVPEPQFHAVPNTPMYSPQSVAPMPLNDFAQHDGHLPQEQAYTTTMAPNQFFMPAFEPGVADFHPPMTAAPHQIYQEPAPSHPQYHHHQQPQQGLAQRHITPIQYHGLPFNQPTGWPQPQ